MLKQLDVVFFFIFFKLPSLGSRSFPENKPAVLSPAPPDI